MATQVPENLGQGVEIRAQVAYRDDDPDIAAVILTVHPLPTGIEGGLAQHLMTEARLYLVAQGLISGEYTDLSVNTPVQ